MLYKVESIFEIQFSHRANRPLHLYYGIRDIETLGHSGVVANNLSVKLDLSLEFD